MRKARKSPHCMHSPGSECFFKPTIDSLILPIRVLSPPQLVPERGLQTPRSYASTRQRRAKTVRGGHGQGGWVVFYQPRVHRREYEVGGVLVCLTSRELQVTMTSEALPPLLFPLSMEKRRSPRCSPSQSSLAYRHVVGMLSEASAVWCSFLKPQWRIPC